MTRRRVEPGRATARGRSSAPRRLCLFGAAPDTGNLGVSALCQSVLQAIAAREPGAVVTVFDHGGRVRYGMLETEAGRFKFRRLGAVHSWRPARSGNLLRARVAGRMGGLGDGIVRTLRRADLVLDASGGDSFSDLYGPRRFRAITLPKLIALQQRRPLVLLPQTYGPFRRRGARRLARRIVRGAAMAWARDRASFAVLRQLLGDDFHPARHRCGVDLAFGLPPRRLREDERAALGPVAGWVTHPDARPLVGLNVSGLLYNGARAGSRFGLRADYREVLHKLLQRLLTTEARIVLVPHVLGPHGRGESDLVACRAVASCVRTDHDRLATFDGFDDPAATKWLIGRCDWFCGTRLHATIAAMSSGVPAAAIAYSDKTAGVFETCGLRSAVADARWAGTEEVVEKLWRAWTGRAAAQSALDVALPRVRRQVSMQLDAMLGVGRSPARLTPPEPEHEPSRSAAA